ncbi:MAG: hypothetical protein ACYDHE_11250 [Candidatus Acidiferrales bacterium]
MKLASIYGLFDPRSPDTIMYVGKGGENRANGHWKIFTQHQRKEGARLTHWFEKLQSENITPGWRFLQENVKDWQMAERKWIHYWRFENPELCNVADGGNEPHRNSAQIGGFVNGGKGLRKAWELHRDKMLENQRKSSGLGGKMAARNHQGGGIGVARRLHPEKLLEASRKNAPLGSHKRWCINMGRPSNKCRVCNPFDEVARFEAKNGR